jgi:hypothetical protein
VSTLEALPLLRVHDTLKYMPERVLAITNYHIGVGSPYLPTALVAKVYLQIFPEARSI